MKSIDTIIIGAGPYGLSVAAHLKAAGVPFRVYGTPLESWASYMPEGMLLRSEPFASNLWDPKRRYTFQRYCAEKQIPYQAYGKPVPIETFLAYAEWFRANAVGETTDVRVTRVTRAEGGFDVSLADGTSVRAKHVVLATGHMAFQNLPAELKSLPGTLCKHSAQIKDVQRYSGRDVTVVGAGQSALETAALIREAGAKVRLVVRKGGIQWNAPATDSTRSVVAKIRKPEAGLGAGWKILAISELPQVFRMYSPERRHSFVARSWGPSGAWWLRNRVENRVEVLLNHSLQSAVEEGGKVRLTLGSPKGPKEVTTDEIVSATGFKTDLSRLGYLDPELTRSIALEGNAVALSRRFETSVPGLFLVGIATAPTFGPVMRFMFGAKHAAPAIARRVKNAR